MSDATQQQTPTPRPRGRDGRTTRIPPGGCGSLWRQGQQPRVEDFLEQAGVRDPEQIVMALRVDQAERAGWASGCRPRPTSTPSPPSATTPDAAVDLIFAEYLLREERGEPPPLEEFLRRFPEHAGELKLQIELHRAMEAGGAPTAPARWLDNAARGGRLRPADGPRPIPRSPATRSWACWAGAAWGSCIAPGRPS